MKKSFIFTMFVFIVVLVSCNNVTNSKVNYKAGTLVLSIKNNDSRTITPDIDMSIAMYLVEGTGPSGTSFTSDQRPNDEVFVKDELREGDWTIKVTGKNSTGTVVGEGSVDVVVSQLSSTEAQVSVEPISGTGCTDISITWPAEETITPSITGKLVPAAGVEIYLNPPNDNSILAPEHTPIGLNFDENNKSINNSVQNGYYLLALTLNDEGKVIWTKNDMIRVITGETTTVLYELEAVQLNQLEGNLNLSINDNMAAPLVINIYLEQVIPLDKENINYRAYFDLNDIYSNYTWLLDGEKVEVIKVEDGGFANHYINLDLEHGRFYELTVITFENSQIGSKSISFIAEEYYAGH